MNARPGEGHDLIEHATIMAATYVVRTPCHQRRVFLDERELEQGRRSVTVPCPGCSGLWVVEIAMPSAVWTR